MRLFLIPAFLLLASQFKSCDRPSVVNNDLYPNGQKHYDRHFVNGKLEGQYKEYYADGRLKIKGSYLQGHKDDIFELYTPDGNLALQTLYCYGNMRMQKLYYRPINKDSLQYKLVSKPGLILARDGVRIVSPDISEEATASE